MLYIFNLIFFLIWAIYVTRKGKLSRHAIVNLYVFTLFIVDIPEVIFNQLMGLYKFPTHLLADPVQDNLLGIVLGDSFILPLVGIIFGCYVKQGQPWRMVLPFTLGFVILEWVYLKLGYVHYNHWSIWYSTFFYFIGLRLVAHYAPRFVTYHPPIPYQIRLFCFSYTALVLPSAFFGAIFNLLQWRPGFFEDIHSDDRFTALGSIWVLSLITMIIIPKTPRPYKLAVFIMLAAFATFFALYAYWSGWLIYHHWNHFFTAMRYFVPFAFVMWYDRWETAYEKNQPVR
jgi:hypothetical protein